MDTFNSATPYRLDMQWVKDDTFTFLDSTITIWLSEDCVDGLDLDLYDGILSIKYRPQDTTLATIDTDSGDMIFTGNVITFSKPDLSLKVGEYFYQLKLYNKIDNNIVGTLLDGKFNVKN